MTKAVKRAQILALMPKIWKLSRFRHASFADAYSRPEKRSAARTKAPQHETTAPRRAAGPALKRVSGQGKGRSGGSAVCIS